MWFFKSKKKPADTQVGNALPCPICGRNVRPHQGRVTGLWYMVCPKCDLVMGSGHETLNGAIQLWNNSVKVG